MPVVGAQQISVRVKDTAQALMEQDVEQTAVRLLATREHSRGELRSKLCARSFDPGMVDQVLERLATNGLLSDARFTEQYVLSCRKRGLGPIRIRAELRQRGIDAQLVASWLDEDSDEWLALLREVHHKKFGPTSAGDPREIARRARFLQYRGFDTEQIRRFLKS